MRQYPDLGSAPDWSCREGDLLQPIRSTTQILVRVRHQYGISVLVFQTSFRQETTVGVAKCRLFSRAIVWKITFQQQIRPMFVERTKNATRTRVCTVNHEYSRLRENRCNETNIS